MMKNVLVTGYQGFIGKELNGKPFKGRLENYQDLINSIENVDGIVHLAAKSSRISCENDPRGCISSNLVGLSNVLEVALRRNIWVLFISTFQVKERNLYGMTKLVGEELCRIYQNEGLKVKILRLPIVYGPDDRHHKVATRIMNAIKSGFKAKIDNKKKFYFAYVTDIAKVIENEVDMMMGNIGKKSSLMTLDEGIRKFLHEEKK